MSDGAKNYSESTSAYAEALAQRLAFLLEQMDEHYAEIWVAEITQAAESRGWIFSANDVRTEPLWVLGLDLFIDNPAAGDLINLNFDRTIDPGEVEDICWFVDHL